MITPTWMDVRTTWDLRSAIQKPTTSYSAPGTPIRLLSAFGPPIAPKSTILLLLQLLDLQLIIKIILFQKKSWIEMGYDPKSC
jgi:hypothetical protein